MLIGDGRGGAKEWRLDRGYCPKKTRETVDRSQNNGSVKAVSPRHCPATCALRNCCFNYRARAESQRQCPQKHKTGCLSLYPSYFAHVFLCDRVPDERGRHTTLYVLYLMEGMIILRLHPDQILLLITTFSMHSWVWKYQNLNKRQKSPIFTLLKLSKNNNTQKCTVQKHAYTSAHQKWKRFQGFCWNILLLYS